MPNVEKLIGAKIKETRRSKGFTQEHLSEMIDVSVETISRLERGVSMPSLKTLENIAQAFGAPLKSFFDFDEKPSKNKTFERELSRLIAFLRTLNIKQIKLIREVLKTTFALWRS